MRTSVTTDYLTDANKNPETYLLDTPGKIEGRNHGSECRQPREPRPDKHPKLDHLFERHIVRPFVLILSHSKPSIPLAPEPLRLAE